MFALALWQQSVPATAGARQLLLPGVEFLRATLALPGVDFLDFCG
jgi:hypothetical protein